VNLANVLSSKGSENKIIFTDDFPVDIRDSSLVELDEASRTRSLRKRVLSRSIKQNRVETRRLISSIMEKHNGNKAAVARELQISRMTLYRHLKKFDISVS
jgi:transcriptional regulator with PAS, ATPase and Fis domain